MFKFLCEPIVLKIGNGLASCNESECLPLGKAIIYIKECNRLLVKMQRHVTLLVQGVGGPVNWLLSWSCWVPLARLSYSCYLVHMTVVDWVLTLPSYSVTITHTLVLYHILANTAVSLAVAFVLVVLFEAPLLHMEKLLFGFMGLGKLPQVKKKAKVA
jgi:hypothetical protein